MNLEDQLLLFLFGLVCFCVGGVTVRAVDDRLAPIPLVYQFPGPRAEIVEAPYPVALCFGKTIVGDGIILQNDYLRAPLLIMGDNTTIISSSFTGSEFGIYLAGDSKLWLSGSILMGNKVAFASGNSKTVITGLGQTMVTRVGKQLTIVP